MAGAHEGLPYPVGLPGDAQDVASKLGSLASAMGRHATAVPTAAPGAWRGFAAAMYAETARTSAGALSSGAGPASSAAAAVARAGRVLEEAQQEVERLARQVRRAREHAERLEQEAVRAEQREARLTALSAAVRARSTSTAQLTGATSPLGVLPGRALPGSPLSAAQGEAAQARRAADDAEREHQRERRQAEGRAQEACDRVEAADATAAGAVRAAAGAAPSSASMVPGVVRDNAPVWLYSTTDNSYARDATRDWFEHLDRDAEGLYLNTEEMREDRDWGPTYAHYDPRSNTVHYVRWHRYNDWRNWNDEMGAAREVIGLLGGPGARRLAEEGRKVANHPGDWEGVSVRLDDDGRPREVMYRAHESKEWYVKPYDQVVSPDGRLRVHVTQGGHSQYHSTEGIPNRLGPIGEEFAEPGEQGTADARADLAGLRGQPFAGRTDVEHGRDGVDEPYRRLPGAAFMDDLDDEPGHQEEP